MCIQYFVSPCQCFLSPVSLLHLFFISHTFIRYCYRQSHLPLVSFFARINFQFYQHICSQLFCSVVFFPSVALVAVRLKAVISLVISSSDSIKYRNNVSIVVFSLLYFFSIIFAHQCFSIVVILYFVILSFTVLTHISLLITCSNYPWCWKVTLGLLAVALSAINNHKNCNLVTRFQNQI